MWSDVESADIEHPSRTDRAYLSRRDEISAQALGPGRIPAVIDYTDDEHQVWAAVRAALDPEWQRHACREVLGARDRLGLPHDRIPQLADVSAGLAPLSGFRYEAVPGLVTKEEFFAALADGRFLSTQFVRHPVTPLYTPEPDVIHEVMGHANCLADERLAELHRLAGAALTRAKRVETRQFLADVFWFSGEFGVVDEDRRWKAYGAGLLSSFGEMRWFHTHAEVRPLDPAAMGSRAYDITHYQPVLFGASSLDQVLDVVGGFFSAADDDRLAAIMNSLDPS